MLSLFSGIGGIDLAGEMAGIKTVGFCEIDPFCQQILKKHWPLVPIYSDIRKIHKETLENDKIPQIDILCGGFPCQPFSTAGKRRGKEDDRNLFPEMLRLVEEIRPRWVVGENVAGFVDLALDTLLADLESKDYTTIPFIIPACGVGAPHRRYRVFVVAHANGDGWSDELYRQIPKRRASFRKSYTGTWNGRLLDKSSVCRVVDGVPSKLDQNRLKALANAVVPYQIYPIFEAIKAIDKINK